MSRTSHVRLMANYNEWMNKRLYEACARLPPAALAQDRKAFFQSIIGTLNHLVNADLIWLQRFAGHPARYAALAGLPAPLPRLDGIRHERFDDLLEERRRIDSAILAMADAVREEDFEHNLSYANLQGVVWERNFFGCLMHFFNHQTHHRGQVTTLLSQEGVDMGPTDLLLLVPNEVAA